MINFKDLTREEFKICEYLSRFNDHYRDFLIGTGRQIISKNFVNKRRNPNDRGNWNFVANNYRSTPDNLMKIYNYLRSLEGNKMNTIKFLDIGCGYGNITSLAGSIGFRPYGVDYDKSIVPKDSTIGFKNMNAMHLREGYVSEFDVVYLYRPIDDPKRLTKLIKKLGKFMKEGTILYAVYIDSSEGIEESGFKKTNLPSVYVKSK